jgi:hypothetical protein
MTLIGDNGLSDLLFLVDDYGAAQVSIALQCNIGWGREAEINRIQHSPVGTVYSSLPSMSSTKRVKSVTSSGLSANAIMKNSSSGFAVLKNCTTGSRALDLVCHAAAHVEDGPQRNRGILTRKVLDLLPFLASKTSKFSSSSPVT